MMKTHNMQISGKACEYCGKHTFRLVACGRMIGPEYCDCDASVKARADEEREERARQEREELKQRQANAQRLLKESNLGERFQARTFDTFKVTPQNKEAYQDAKSFVADFRKQETKGRGMILAGSVGTGKTHLTAAIVNDLVQIGIDCIFGNITTLLGRLKNSYNGDGDNEAEIMGKYCNCALLVIDDLGKEKTTEWVQEKLYTIINHRYEHYRKTIITTNDNFKTLEAKLGEAVVSRLIEMCDGYKLDGSDYRKRKLQ